jgi:transcription antitermination factor NusG
MLENYKKMEVKEKKWYTVKVQSNREKSVSEKLKLDMDRDFKEEVNVLIPTQKLSFIKNGKVKQKEMPNDFEDFGSLSEVMP